MLRGCSRNLINMWIKAPRADCDQDFMPAEGWKRLSLVCLQSLQAGEQSGTSATVSSFALRYCHAEHPGISGPFLCQGPYLHLPPVLQELAPAWFWLFFAVCSTELSLSLSQSVPLCLKVCLWVTVGVQTDKCTLAAPLVPPQRLTDANLWGLLSTHAGKWESRSNQWRLIRADYRKQQQLSVNLLQ